MTIPPDSTPPASERRSAPREVPRSSTPRGQVVPIAIVTVLLLVLVVWVTSMQRNAQSERDRRAAEGTLPQGDSTAIQRR